MPLADSCSIDLLPIDNLLNLANRAEPTDWALATATSTYSWQQLAAGASNLASQYLALGLKPGDRVASLMPNCPDLVIHYLACFQAGLVATPLNYRYMAPEMDHALRISGASILLHHAERDADVAASQLGTKLPHGVIRYGADDGLAISFADLMARPQTTQPLPGLDGDMPAIIYFTSGSTGKPKGVTHTRRTFSHMMAACMGGMELTANDIFLPSSSFSHIGGSLFGLSALAAGGRLIVPAGSGGSETLQLLRDLRPTVLWMLPSALIAMVRDHGATTDCFSSVRLCISGGDKVPHELEREFTSLAGFPIDESYGMTEIGIATINPPSGENRLGSIGKLCPGYEMSLRDDTGAKAPAGKPGRLWIRSAGNTIGYWNNPQATAETIVDGWLDTGDVMQVDDDGFLWFCGRKKQIIIHDGSNICPQEVEEAIAEHPAVDAVGVVGVHDAVHGENVCAYVTLKPEALAPSRDDLILFARQRVGYKAPEEIVLIDAMPLNATGKVDRGALKHLAEQRVAIPSKQD